MAQIGIEFAGGRRPLLLGHCMPGLLTSFAANMAFAPRERLKRPRALLACLILPCLLVGCTGMLADGLVATHVVVYPMRSPEYVLRDLGGDRYLLAQWDVPLNANVVQRLRYYDRSTGMLTHLPENVTVFRVDYLANTLGALRYESDAPLQIAFFGRYQTNYDRYCMFPDKPAEDKSPPPMCGYLDIVLSLDGGHSFARRRVNIPTSMGRGRIDTNRYEFAIVRNNTLYLGLYVGSTDLPEFCYLSADGNLENLRRVSYARRFEGKAVPGRYVFLSVLAMSLPNNAGKPLPAAQIPRELAANVLTGDALMAFDLGRPMALLETPPTVPEPPDIQYTRADRKTYIESLRAKYPAWAAHQTLDDIPSRQQWLSSQEIRELRAKQTRRGDDPVEWVPFERPAAK